MFQFTRPRGARPRFPAREPNTVKFQFTRPRGARLWVSWSSRALQTCFNSRAHGGRDKGMFVGLGNAAFQFTRPRGARRPANRRPTPSKRFNSRAHGGRDAPNRGRPSRGGVSIHAPTGGATAEPANVRKGAAGFNSRAHGGRDRPSPSSSRASGVSIHAPTGGATMFPVISSFVSAGFNSRAHGGRDRHDTIVSRRGRRFNSRAHGGRDAERSQRLAKEEVSIHAPTGGATRRKSTPRAT